MLSRKQLAGYALPTYHRVFQLPVGGNALVFSPHGRTVFIGGNGDSRVTEVRLSTGTVSGSYPVARSGDLVWAAGQVFSADIKSGVLTALNPKTGRIVRIQTPEVDPAFQYAKIPAATAGFMQLAVSPHQRYVYAAGFSGHILRFSARLDRLVGRTRVALPGVNK